MSEKKSFRDATEDVLNECSRWLKDNASNLAETLSDGCQHWEIKFSWDTIDDAHDIPKIEIAARKIDRGMIGATFSHEIEF